MARGSDAVSSHHLPTGDVPMLDCAWPVAFAAAAAAQPGAIAATDTGGATEPTSPSSVRVGPRARRTRGAGARSRPRR
jgi:hypothetical protein